MLTFFNSPRSGLLELRPLALKKIKSEPREAHGLSRKTKGLVGIGRGSALGESQACQSPTVLLLV